MVWAEPACDGASRIPPQPTECNPGFLSIGKSLHRLDDCPGRVFGQKGPRPAATTAADQSQLPFARLAEGESQHWRGVARGKPLRFGHDAYLSASGIGC